MLSYHTCPLATLGGKDTGGMNVYVRDLTRQLGRMGIPVDVFTRSQDEHVPHVLHDLGYGNRVVHIPAGSESPLPKAELANFLPQFVAGIREFAVERGVRYDLIHSHYWTSGIAGRDLKAAWNVPMVHMFHTLGMMKNRVARSAEEAEGEYRLRGERDVLRAADRVVAATPAELAQLQWLYQADTRKVVIIPPGVDTSRFYPIHPADAKDFIGIPHTDRMLLFVGRIEPLKGIDTLIEAMSRMHKTGVFDEADCTQVGKNQKRCSMCLSVIGGDPGLDHEKLDNEMGRLQEIRQAHGLNELVTFLGRRSQDTLPYYYSAAEAVVVPSHYESFGMVALEAMACGTPVVASEVGGLAFLVRDGFTGFTVPVDDPKALAERLTLLINNPALRKRMGEQAALSAKEYAWEKIAGRIVKVYEEVTRLDQA